MSDTRAARLRTVWPAVVGHIATWVAAVAVHKLGFSPDMSPVIELAVIELVSVAATWVAWDLGRWLEARPNPVAAALGRWLIAAGKEIGPPTYGQNYNPPVTPTD